MITQGIKRYLIRAVWIWCIAFNSVYLYASFEANSLQAYHIISVVAFICAVLGLIMQD